MRPRVKIVNCNPWYDKMQNLMCWLIHELPRVVSCSAVDKFASMESWLFAEDADLFGSTLSDNDIGRT